MQKSWKVIMLLSLGAFIFTSCDNDSDDDSDDDSDGGGSVNENYYTDTVGSYRIYQNYKDGEMVGQDSVIVEMIGTTLGKESYTEASYSAPDSDRNFGTSSRDIVYYEENGELFASGSLVSLFKDLELDGVQFELPVSVDENAWFKISSNKNESWLVFEDDAITDFSIPYGGLEVNFTEPLTINGESTMGQSTTVGNTNYNDCIKVEWTISTQIGTTIGIFPVNTPVEFTIVNYYAKSIGLVKAVQDEFVIGSEFQNFGIEPITIPETISDMIDTNIQ